MRCAHICEAGRYVVCLVDQSLRRHDRDIADDLHRSVVDPGKALARAVPEPQPFKLAQSVSPSPATPCQQPRMHNVPGGKMEPVATQKWVWRSNDFIIQVGAVVDFKGKATKVATTSPLQDLTKEYGNGRCN